VGYNTLIKKFQASKPVFGLEENSLFGSAALGTSFCLATTLAFSDLAFSKASLAVASADFSLVSI
jgi:hypothetical protein